MNSDAVFSFRLIDLGSEGEFPIGADLSGGELS